MAVEQGLILLIYWYIYVGKLDMRHKLTTFILKNPPDGPQEGGVKKRKKGDDKDDIPKNGDVSPDENGVVSYMPSKYTHVCLLF